MYDFVIICGARSGKWSNFILNDKLVSMNVKTGQAIRFYIQPVSKVYTVKRQEMPHKISPEVQTSVTQRSKIDLKPSIAVTILRCIK
jgi:hypothetical protein